MPNYPYKVTCTTLKGDVELIAYSTHGPDEAASKVQEDLVLARHYGGWDDVRPVAVASVCAWWASCDNVSTGAMPHPALGDVPICDRCRAAVDALKTDNTGRG